MTDYGNGVDYSNDAWKKYLDVINEFTEEYVVRENDIEVTAFGWDRGVEVTLYEKIDKSKFGREYASISTGRRSVATMREFAVAILDACDFVDEVNPGWASQRQSVEGEWKK